MKQKFLLVVGPLLLLSGCGISKKSHKSTYHEPKEIQVNTDLDNFEEEDGSVRSFFQDIDSDGESDFEWSSHKNFTTLDSFYDDEPMTALDMEYEVIDDELKVIDNNSDLVVQ